MHALILKPGREKSLLHRHPWIYSGAVERIKTAGSGEPQAGDTVVVRDANGRFLALAGYSPASQIRARVWSFRESDVIEAGFLRARLAAAIARRQPLQDDTDACRLVHGESDGLPGLVVDRYAGQLVVQILSAPMETRRETIADLLVELTGCADAYERSDSEIRELEGLAQRCGVLRGAEPGETTIIENGLRYDVDVRRGQKTGFYLDQRDNRRRIGELAAGREVLNCFCYSGGFSLAALAGGAQSVLSLDSSAEALAQAARNLALNDLPGERAEWREADVFKALRLLRDQGRQFGLIVLDPPKFAPTAQHAARAARAYKDINLWAFKLLAPGGLLATFTCSGGVDAALFQKIVAGAALDAGCDGRILARLGAGADHPLSLAFPEGEYLKGLLIAKD